MLNAYYFYRLGHLLHKYKIPVIPKLVKLITFLVYNSSIPPECKIGHGTRFAYGGIGVVLHKRSVLGKNCTIGTNVTIGGRSKHYNVPEIGNNVYISTGSKILGPIKIGDNAVIGANAVVIHDVPPNTTVVGVPAKAHN
jgi:serine O-acetyltransferase